MENTKENTRVTQDSTTEYQPQNFSKEELDHIERMQKRQMENLIKAKQKNCSNDKASTSDSSNSSDLNDEDEHPAYDFSDEKIELPSNLTEHDYKVLLNETGKGSSAGDDEYQSENLSKEDLEFIDRLHKFQVANHLKAKQKDGNIDKASTSISSNFSDLNDEDEHPAYDFSDDEEYQPENSSSEEIYLKSQITEDKIKSFQKEIENLSPEELQKYLGSTSIYTSPTFKKKADKPVVKKSRSIWLLMGLVFVIILIILLY